MIAMVPRQAQRRSCPNQEERDNALVSEGIKIPKENGERRGTLRKLKMAVGRGGEMLGCVGQATSGRRGWEEEGTGGGKGWQYKGGETRERAGEVCESQRPGCDVGRPSARVWGRSCAPSLLQSLLCNSPHLTAPLRQPCRGQGGATV